MRIFFEKAVFKNSFFSLFLNFLFNSQPSANDRFLKKLQSFNLSILEMKDTIYWAKKSRII